MRTHNFISQVGTAAAVVLLAAACDRPLPLQPEESAAFSRSVHAETARDDLLRSVRQATSRFNSTTQAIRAGYLPSDHCVAHPDLGGMGYHWANPDLIDEVFDPRQPELMLYATGPGGNLRLVGVEYIVLAPEGADLDGPARPHFGTQPFDIGGTPTPQPHWSLHVWLFEANPAGIFKPFNPVVSCP
jgi:hypothetical protein